MLVVVVVRDWESDDGNGVARMEKIHREAAAGGWQKNGFVTGGGHDGGKLAGKGEIEWGARRRITGAPFDFHYLCRPEARGGIGGLANDRVASRHNVPFHQG